MKNIDCSSHQVDGFSWPIHISTFLEQGLLTCSRLMPLVIASRTLPIESFSSFNIIYYTVVLLSGGLIETISVPATGDGAAHSPGDKHSMTIYALGVGLLLASSILFLFVTSSFIGVDSGCAIAVVLFFCVSTSFDHMRLMCYRDKKIGLVWLNTATRSGLLVLAGAIIWSGRLKVDDKTLFLLLSSAVLTPLLFSISKLGKIARHVVSSDIKYAVKQYVSFKWYAANWAMFTLTVNSVPYLVALIGGKREAAIFLMSRSIVSIFNPILQAIEIRMLTTTRSRWVRTSENRAFGNILKDIVIGPIGLVIVGLFAVFPFSQVLGKLVYGDYGSYTTQATKAIIIAQCMWAIAMGIYTASRIGGTVKSSAYANVVMLGVYILTGPIIVSKWHATGGGVAIAIMWLSYLVAMYRKNMGFTAGDAAAPRGGV